MNKTNNRPPVLALLALLGVPSSAAPQVRRDDALVLDCTKPSSPCFEWANTPEPIDDEYYIPPPLRRFNTAALEYPQLANALKPVEETPGADPRGVCRERGGGSGGGGTSGAASGEPSGAELGGVFGAHLRGGC